MLASIFCKYLHIFLDGRLIHTIFWGFSLKTATILKISISVLNATDLTVSKNGERKNVNIPRHNNKVILLFQSSLTKLAQLHA